MTFTACRDRRRGMALLTVVVLIGVTGILTTLAVQVLLKTRIAVRRQLSRVQARWLAQAAVERVIAAHLDRSPATQPAPVKQRAPDALGVEGAAVTCRVTARGHTRDVHCEVRIREANTRYVLHAGLDLPPGRARIAAWGED